MTPDAYREMAQVQATHWWYVARREILRTRLRDLRLPEGADILEVGSGTGANLDLLSEFGKVVGLEMAADAITLARKRTGGTAAQVTMHHGRCPEDLPTLSQRFDLICLFDVLEHIEEDELALARLGAMLKPGGCLMLTVPAYPWMWGPHDVHFHHKRRYTQRSLRERCSHAGLSVSRMSHFNTLLFPIAVLGRMYERITGKKSAATLMPPLVVNSLLTRVFQTERYMLDRLPLPFGLSLFLLVSRGEHA